MKRFRTLIIPLTLAVLLLAGCGQQPTASSEKATQKSEKAATDTAKYEDTSEGSETNAGGKVVLSNEDIEAAKKVAWDYYAGTVFDVNSMTYIKPGTNNNAEGECNFMVNVSKDGQVQEPDRMVQLNRKGDTWEIVNEGF